MKKRLLFALVAMCVSVSGFALSEGEFVYTPQGRFQITGVNQNPNNAFQSMDGWTAIGEGKTLADLFSTNADGLSAGFNSVVSTAATAGEGMYFKFEPTDASAAYVVSFKMKGAALDNVKIRIPGDGNKKEDNLVKVAGNAANAYTYPATEEEVIANTAEELTENWQTFNYAIVGDGTPRTWFISFTTMATTIEIADLQIAPAVQLADLRQRDAMLEKLNAYKNCFEWPAAVLADMGVDEAIAGLQAIGDVNGQAELEDQLATAQEIIDEFIKANMDDYLAGKTDNYLGIKETSGNTQKVSNYGDWSCLPSGRAFWSSGAYPDLGHYAGNSAWSWNDTEAAMGVYMQKTLDPGSYVFAIEGNAALREDPTSSSWTNNDGWNPAYGVAYVVKMVDGAAADTIVSVVKDLDAVNYTPFFAVAKIAEAGTYEIGFKAFCKDAYKSLKNGSVVYVKDASIWGKNNNKYNQKQLGYEADVREQITTGRAQLTTATEYLANADYLWGKDVLKACVDTVEVKIAKYETLDQDAIINTYNEYDGEYVKSTSSVDGILVYEVYQEAVKDIIAANKKFLAVNDTLASIQTAIDAAEATMKLRVYDAATGGTALLAVIDNAKTIQAAMKAAQYSEENAAAIVAAIAELSEAVEAFKVSVPASAIATVVDIDFENDAVLNGETNLYSIAGAAGSMEFSAFSTAAAENNEFEKGFWSNGEQLWKGYIRVGNGTGTVLFDPKPAGAADMGTDILRIACDFYVQGLSGRNLGFFVKDEEGNNICGLYRNYYDGKDDTNTFNADMSYVWTKAGGSYNDASPADVTEEEGKTANPLQKTHFEVIMDFGRKSMYCTINSVNGSYASEEIALEAIPASFVLQSNYAVATRRPWFDNLKIERITAGATEPFVDAVETVKAVAADNAIFSLSGQKLSAAPAKGLYIQNGKKYVVK